MNFKFSSSNHIIINIKINGIKGNFIVDSGASNSCVNYQAAKKFKLIFKKTKSKAYSAISNINEIFYSKQNTLKIGKLIKKNFEFILFDMHYINININDKKIGKIDGIIGNDILKEYKAIINYEEKKLILKL